MVNKKEVRENGGKKCREKKIVQNFFSLSCYGLPFVGFPDIIPVRLEETVSERYQRRATYNKAGERKF